MSLRGRMPESTCLARFRALPRRAVGALLAAGMALGAAEAMVQAARAAVHPVIPRPACDQAPPRSLVQAEALPPACRGPLVGARPAPRRLPGRQQHRMRWCNEQARLHALRGEQRQEFIRHCLHRGG